MKKQEEITRLCPCTICDTLVWIVVPPMVVDDEEEICLGIICDKCAKSYPPQEE